MAMSVGRETPASACVQEIVVVIATRGQGDNGDPVRTVTQYWSREGRLLAEHDPSHPSPALQYATF